MRLFKAHARLRLVVRDPQFEQDLKDAGVIIEQFRKMTMRQRPDLNLPKRAGAKIGRALDAR